MNHIKISPNENTFLKNPESSDLGKRILKHSVIMIHKLGFEDFTFKKLGKAINSTESSIYRYFENKHKLLLYLASWHWGWLEYQLVMETSGIPSPKDRLNKALDVITRPVINIRDCSHIDTELLYGIIINEYSKSYLNKEVDQENKEGYFEIYKRLVTRLGDMITAVNGKYPYPHSLASTVLEGILHQSFLMDHFPTLTDCNKKITPKAFFSHLVFNALNTNPHV